MIVYNNIPSQHGNASCHSSTTAMDVTTNDTVVCLPVVTADAVVSLPPAPTLGDANVDDVLKVSNDSDFYRGSATDMDITTNDTVICLPVTAAGAVSSMPLAPTLSDVVDHDVLKVSNNGDFVINYCNSEKKETQIAESNNHTTTTTCTPIIEKKSNLSVKNIKMKETRKKNPTTAKRLVCSTEASNLVRDTKDLFDKPRTTAYVSSSSSLSIIYSSFIPIYI